jgi:hypothetical protein
MVAMGPTTLATGAVATIAAMITPALFIMGSANLVGSALQRLARIVDRTRALSTIADKGTLTQAGMTVELLRSWIEHYQVRARFVGAAIAILYGAIAAFVATCLFIAIDRGVNEAIDWAPLTLAISGTLLLLIGSVLMVYESRLSGAQLDEEIRHALSRLE